MKGFDVWKLLGGKAPRGFKGNAAKEAARAASGGGAKAPSMADAVSAQDLLTLLGLSTAPIAGYTLGRKWTKEKRREGGDE